MARTGFGRKNNNGNSVSGMQAAGTLTPPRVAVAGPESPIREMKPTAEDIRKKAYELYQARAKAGRPGDSTTDWLEAERQLRTSAGPAPLR